MYRLGKLRILISFLLAVVLLVIAIPMELCTVNAASEEEPVLETESDPNPDYETESDPDQGPDPNFHIYLAFGQSNMTGASFIEEQDMDCDDDLLVMCSTDSYVNPITLEQRTYGNWYKAIPPLADSAGGQLSVSDYFAREILEKKKKENPDVKVGIIVVAVPGSGIEFFDKYTYLDYFNSLTQEQRGFLSVFYQEYGGSPYQRLVDCAKLAQKDGVIKGIIMHQGESDFMVGGWHEEVEKIYDDLKKDLDLEEDIPFVAGEVRYGTIVSDKNLDENILSSRRDNFFMVSSRELMYTDVKKGDVHFSSEEYRVFGRRYAREMLDAERILSRVEEPAKVITVKNTTKDTEYYSLDEALKDADEDEKNELILLGDTKLNKFVTNFKDISLDLNGYSVDFRGRDILNYGKLALVNTGENNHAHYFIRNVGSWKAIDSSALTDEQKEKAYELDAGTALGSERYLKAKGSIIYNGGGTRTSGGAVVNSCANGKKGVLEVDNVGFVKCIAYNGGTILNEGGTLTLKRARAYGCRAAFGGFVYNCGGGRLYIENSRVKLCEASGCGAGVLNLGNAAISGFKAHYCTASQYGGAICNGTDDIKGAALVIDDAHFKGCSPQAIYTGEGSSLRVPEEGEEIEIPGIEEGGSGGDSPKVPDSVVLEPKLPVITDPSGTENESGEEKVKGDIVIKDSTGTVVNEKGLELKGGEQEFLTAFLPGDEKAVPRTVTWKSDSKKVRVKNGMVTAKDVAEEVKANLTAVMKLTDPATGRMTGVVTQNVRVRVTPVAVEKNLNGDKTHQLKLKKSLDLVMDEGSPELSIDLKAKGGTDISAVRIQEVLSTNENVVGIEKISEITPDGKKGRAVASLKPKRPGTAYVVVKSTSEDGSVVNVKRCKIKVTSPAKAISIGSGTLEVQDGKTMTMKAGESGCVRILLDPGFSTDWEKVKLKGSGGITVRDGVIYAKRATGELKPAKLTAKCGKLKATVEVIVTR